jgi:Spy/CpxP family protein refolding chaperone
MKQDLGLSTEQVQKIQAVNQRFKTQHETLHQKLQPLQEKLRTLLQADNPNLNEVKSLIQQISVLRGEVWILMVSHRIEINAILTPQQREKDRDIHRRRMNERAPHGGDRGPGPGGCSRGGMNGFGD